MPPPPQSKFIEFFPQTAPKAPKAGAGAAVAGRDVSRFISNVSYFTMKQIQN